MENKLWQEISDDSKEKILENYKSSDNVMVTKVLEDLFGKDNLMEDCNSIWKEISPKNRQMLRNIYSDSKSMSETFFTTELINITSKAEAKLLERIFGKENLMKWE